MKKSSPTAASSGAGQAEAAPPATPPHAAHVIESPRGAGASEPATPAPPPQTAPGVWAPLSESAFAAISAAEALSLGLTPAQRTAIEKLTSGHTRIASATAAGVNRITLYRWLRYDLAFLAAYNAWQHDAIATARARLLALTDTAVTTVGNAMLKGDGRLALRLLEHLGIADRPHPGATEVDDLEDEQALERKRQQLQKRKEADHLFLEEALTPPDFQSASEDPDSETEAAGPEEVMRVRYKRLE